MTRGLLAALVALLALPAPAARAEPPAPVPLDRGWAFAPAGDAWRPVAVPHVMDPAPTDRSYEGGVGTYRVRFTGPRGAAAWAVRFEGVRRRAEVWLNGAPLGRNGDPYTPFELPARGLRPGAPNELVVRVDARRTPGMREGWWNWGGITRRVRLVPQGAVQLRGTGVLSDLECTGPDRCAGGALVDTWVRNRTARTVRPLVRARVGDSERTVRARAIPPGEEARVQLRLPVARPRLWAPGRPALVDARVEARLGDRVESVERRRVGLRDVAVRDGRLLVNGRVVALRGASIQEDLPGRGAALTDADVRRIVADLRALGANVTRAHHLLDERLLSALDAAGILVWSQAPVYHRDVALRTAAGRARELAVVRRTVLAARSHPSVLTHSVANELREDAYAESRAFLAAAADATRDLDPTVPVSVDVLSWPGLPRQAVYDRFALLGINSYYGWYEGRPRRSTAALADLEPYLRLMRERYPRLAMVMTEFGAEAIEPGPAERKETYAFQAAYVRRNLDVVERHDWLGGAIYWTLREFAVKPRWQGGVTRPEAERDAIHNKGLLSYAGARKPAWETARAAFAATPVFVTGPRPSARPGPAGPPPLSVAAGLLLLAALALAALALVRWSAAVWRGGPAPAAPPRRTARAAGGALDPSPSRVS